MKIIITQDIGNITKKGDVHEVCEDMVGRLYIRFERDEKIDVYCIYLWQIEGSYDVLRWKPEVYGRYYTLFLASEFHSVSDARWLNDISDRGRYKNKIVFKTEDEALEVLKKVMKVLE